MYVCMYVACIYGWAGGRAGGWVDVGGSRHGWGSGWWRGRWAVGGRAAWMDAWMDGRMIMCAYCMRIIMQKTGHQCQSMLLKPLNISQHLLNLNTLDLERLMNRELLNPEAQRLPWLATYVCFESVDQPAARVERKHSASQQVHNSEHVVL